MNFDNKKNIKKYINNNKLNTTISGMNTIDIDEKKLDTLKEEMSNEQKTN